MNFAIKFLSVCVLAIVISGCANVTPVINDSKESEWDGNSQDAGIVRCLPDGGLEITIHALNKYNSLINLYGHRIGVVRDFGISKLDNGNFSMTNEAFEDWYRLKLISKREEAERAK